MTLRWQNMSDAEREREYSPSSCLPDGDYRPFVEAYQRRSRDSWLKLDDLADVAKATVRYGPGESNTIDVAVPTIEGSGPRPLLVFFHGGYWQELSKVDSRFAAWDCVQQGWAFAAVDYTLAPDADVSTIVDECRQSIQTLHAQAGALGVDAGEIVVSGSSAGAHLAAMVATDIDGVQDAISGAVLVSGVFELEPLVGTSINDALSLDRETAAQSSPLRADLTGFPPTVIAYGDNETAEFKAQSTVFAERLHAAGTPVTSIEVPERNHFDIILDLAAPNTHLGDATAALITDETSRWRRS